MAVDREAKQSLFDSPMEWYYYIAIIIAGFAAGFINTLAGSGSLITLPLLIFLGIPATIANGTNRVAILFQNIIGVSSFRKNKLLEFRSAIYLVIPGVIGGVIGALIAVDLDEQMMRRVIGILMAVMLVVIVIRPRRWIKKRQQSEGIDRPGIVQFLIFFVIGIYGGFIQAGVGLFMLVGLMLSSGLDEIRANAVKVLIILCFTVFALAIFILNDQVLWSVGLTMAIGNMLGAWVAVKTAIKRGNKFVRWVLIVVVAASTVKLLWDF